MKTDKITLTIRELDAEYLAQTIALVKRRVPAEQPGQEGIAESLGAIVRHGQLTKKLEDSKLSEEERNKAETALKELNSAVKEAEKIDFTGCRYLIAIDNKTDELVGISGTYKATDGYMAKMNFDVGESSRKDMESPKAYWGGWTAVDERFRYRGIGLVLAQQIGDYIASQHQANQLNGVRFCLESEPTAVSFHGKNGFKVMVNGVAGCIMSATFGEVEAKLVPRAKLAANRYELDVINPPEKLPSY
jgi:hypothetical protein